MPANIQATGTNNDPYLNDGYSTTITFSLGFNFYEKELTPMGFGGRGGIDTTGMRNDYFETEVPRTLVKITPISGVIAYSANSLAAILASIQVIQDVVISHSNGATETVTGWLDDFKRNPHKPGEQPTANFVFIPGLQTRYGIETAPSFVSGV